MQNQARALLASMSVGLSCIASVACSSEVRSDGVTRPHDDAGDVGPQPGDRPPPPACPASPPQDGAPCVAAASCEWAGTAGSGCATFGSCFGPGEHWVVAPPPAACGTAPPPCPRAFDTVPSGSACPSKDLSACDYPEGRCGCVTCESSTSDGGTSFAGAWACREWGRADDDQPADAFACPSPRPLAGDPCTAPGALCDYSGYCTGSVAVGPRLICEEGHWRQGQVNFACTALTCSELW